MTYERYMTLCEQMGEEPNIDKIPPEIWDFPDDVQKAIACYNKLGDRIVADIGYLGKDFVSLPLHIEVLDVKDKSIFLETLLRLDEKVIRKSAETMKRERDKLKAK